MPDHDLLADPEVVAADHGHWAAGGFPDSLDDTKTHLVCECGMPWTPGEGCLFVQGIRAQRLADVKVRVEEQYEVRFGDGDRTDWLMTEKKARAHLEYLRKCIAVEDGMDPGDYEPMAVVSRTVTRVKHKTPWDEVRDA